jgi:hypothetical protein
MQAGAATQRDNLMEMPAPFPLTRPEKTSESRTQSLRTDYERIGIHTRLGVMEDRIGTSTNRSKPQTNSVGKSGLVIKDRFQSIKNERGIQKDGSQGIV